MIWKKHAHTYTYTYLHVHEMKNLTLQNIKAILIEPVFLCRKISAGTEKIFITAS